MYFGHMAKKRGPYKKADPAERFWKFVEKQPSGACWHWTGSISPSGYGRFGLRRGTMVQAHRFAYEALVGPIPEGLDLDHLCRVRNCVNPEHLEPVSRAENLRRGVGVGGKRPGGMHEINAAKTHCKHGHEFTPENTAINSASGCRQCRTCHRLRTRARRGGPAFPPSE